MNDIDTEIIP